MGAGLSMASVNKIKELANSREYSLALELVEHQDLTKSLNPQFLRLCGEIYIKNDRYKDARRCLIMAHRLGPESKRVLYTFVELYLRMGYFQLAKTYYDMYMFDANAYDSRDMEYVWNKHEHADDYKTLEPLIAGYAHNLDYDWSFELYLLYKKEEKQNEAATLAELYHASFKNSDNSQIILDIEAGKVKVDTYFDIYADTEAVDDDPDMEALRAEEQELLATDDLRMHPKEAEITIMYEDSYTPAGSEKKVQKMLKKQEREEQRKEKKLLKKQKQQEKAEAAAAAEAEKTEAEVKPATEEKTETETKVPETVADETEQKTAEKASVTETSEQKTAEEASETEAEEPEKEKKKGFFQRRKRKKHEEESETTDADIEETKEVTSESEDVKPSEEPKESNSDISSEIAETTGQAEDMRHGKGTIAKDVVVVDEDDGFEAEADTIEELASKEHVTQETETKEAEVTTAKKTTFEFQTVELAPEDFEEEYEVDDFSETVDDEFGEMKMPEPKPEIEETVEEEPEIEEIAEETVEEEPEVEEEIEEPEVVEPEPEIEAEPESEIEETVEESVKEEPEAELEIEETVEEEPEAEEEIEEPEVVEPEPEVETEPELEIEETVEEEPEVEEEIEEPEVVEPEPEVESESEPEIEETVVEEAVEEEPETEEEIEEPEEEPKEEFHVAPFTTKPEKKKLDFPVFKSSLFPDYHKEVKIVENNFNEIMEEAQDKMTENMQKEEQMQREAEALLASLGISIDSIPTTPQAEKKEEQPVQKGPSRDELKASLKIDSVKKNLLKRVKEYR